MKKTLGAAMLVSALALTSACGGGGDDRPTQGEVKKSITSKDSVFGTAIPETAADCVAGALVDSKLSDKALNAIVENDKDFKGGKSDEKALSGLTTTIGKCATK